MRHALLVGNSHLLSVLEAALCLRDGATKPSSTESMWRRADVGTYDVDLCGPPSVRARFLLVGGVAPPLLRVDEHGLFSVRRRYLRAFVEATKHLGDRIDHVVSCFNGSEHTIFSLLEHPVPFDVLVGSSDVGVPAIERPRQVVPREVIRRELVARSHPTVVYAAILRARFPDQDVVHVVAPPPIEDEEQIHSFPEVYAQVIDDIGVTPAELRRKIYEMYVDVLRQQLERVGVRLLTAPPQAVDDGFLRREFWMEATHANRAYGRLVLEQLGLA